MREDLRMRERLTPEPAVDGTPAPETAVTAPASLPASEISEPAGEAFSESPSAPERRQRRTRLHGLTGDIAGGLSGLRRFVPPRAFRGAARRAVGPWRRHALEVTAVTLMALAGLAYPFPQWGIVLGVWVIGAVVAVTSQLWDLRDKWSGVAGPVAVVIIGIAITVTAGGAHTTLTAYVHEILEGSFFLIKIAALVSAAYLAWRVRQGRRDPREPPWRRQAGS